MPPHLRQRAPQPFSVLLRIGQREFRAQGPNRQLARHRAASKALRVLKSVQPRPTDLSTSPNLQQQEEEVSSSTDTPQSSCASG